jgi:hypothetical protein
MMTRIVRSLLTFVCLMLVAASRLQAQTNHVAAAPELNITLGEQRVRFAPTRAFQEMRLEVLNSVGEIVFTHTTAEAAFEWNLRAGTDAALPPGLYRYALTLRFSEEQSTTHRGHFIVEQGQNQIWLTTGDGAEVSGTALQVSRTGGRSVAGLQRDGDDLAKRDVSGREVVDEKGQPQTKPAKQEKAGVLATANMLAKFAVDGVTLIDSAAIETGGNLGIGTTIPNAKLSVSANTGAPPSAPGITGYFVNANENNTFLAADSYGNGPWHSDFLFRRARGTMAAPTAIAADDIIGQIQARGYGATGFAATSRAGIRMTAAQNWTDAAQGAYLSFLTTPNFSNAINVERVRITDAGNVGIGTTTPAVRLDVVGSSGGAIFATTHGSDNALIGRATGGTQAVPTATSAGQSLLLLAGRGHNGTGFGLNRATVNLEATENFTNTAAGTRITFSTTTNGGLITAEKMRIDHNGNVGIGTTTPGVRLDVAGAIGANLQYNLNGDRILHNTGTTNLFAGVSAGNAITTGFSNAFFGHDAGRLTSTGDRNSFFGRSAGENNMGGNENSFFGHSAGLVNTGSRNSFFGRLAGAANTSGVNNVFVGAEAGLSNNMGWQNTFIGFGTGAANTSGTNNTFIGMSAGAANTEGFQNVAIGHDAGNANTLGGRNTLVGYGANVGNGSLSYATAIGAGAVVSSSNTVRLGRGADSVSIPGNLDVNGFFSAGGAAYISDTGVFQVGEFPGGLLNTGHVCHEAGTLIQCPSTQRAKNQIRSFHTGSTLLQRLRPVTFLWKGNGQPDIGLIAEEVAQVEPRLVTHDFKTGEITGVKYDHLTAVLINAFKEQQAQIAAQQRQIASLKQLVSSTRRRVVALQTMKRKKQ